MASRIIENENERKTCAVLTPFIPCSAKLPIIALFSGYFFKNYASIIAFSLYFFSILVIIISGILIKRFVYKGTSNSYIGELPEYKIPSMKYIIKDVFDKVFSFIKRAGSVILISSVIIWFLSSFSYNLMPVQSIDSSLLATFGKKISWVFYPFLGVNSWEAAISAIQGLVAKEQVISSMSIINEISGNGELFSNGTIFSFFTPASAYSFMVFNLFSIPCISAVSAIKSELGSIKKTILVMLFQVVLAFCLATIVYRIGISIGAGIINVPNVLIVGFLLIVIGKISFKEKSKNRSCARCPYCTSCAKS